MRVTHEPHSMQEGIGRIGDSFAIRWRSGAYKFLRCVEKEGPFRDAKAAARRIATEWARAPHAQ